MKTQYEYYGRIAEAGISDTQQNGRYLMQKDAEALIPDDVMSKLDIRPEDRFLDIGCGVGLNLIPISGIVAEAAGCDHPMVIERLKQKADNGSIKYIGGDFLELDFDDTYNKILVYSVIHTIPDRDTVFSFVRKALSLLAPNGVMLIGDIPNQGKKARFLNSERGKRFQREWEQQREQHGSEDDLSSYQADMGKTVEIDDEMMVELMLQIRQKGFHSYIVDQSASLPFGNTREDLLILGPEYERVLPGQA